MVEDTVDQYIFGGNNREREFEKGRRWLLWVVCAQLIVLYAPTLAWLWERWTLSVWRHDAHGLVLGIAIGYLIRQRLRELSDLRVRSSPWGFVFLVPALLLYTLDLGMHTQLLAAVAMLVALPGFSLLFMGERRTREIGYLLALLFLCLPIPLVVIEPLILALRQIAAVGTSLLVPAFGIPISIEGMTLYVPHGTLFVADSCSGFSLLYSAVSFAFLLVYVVSVGFWRGGTVILLAAPIAVAANIVRIVFLTLLVEWFGIDMLDTSLHEISGYIAIGLALLVIFVLGQLLSTTR